MYKILGSDQKEYGPITGDQVRQWIHERRLHGQSLVRLDGSLTWLPLAQLPEFSAALNVSGPAPMTAPVVAPRTNPMAITGMVMGILSMTLGLCCYGFPFNILGIVFSCIALAQIKKDPELEQGKWLAITGLVLSIFAIAGVVVWFLFIGFAVAASR